jgi:hypothetical protein
MRANTRRRIVRSALLLPIVLLPGGCVGPSQFSDPVPLVVRGAIGELPARPECGPPVAVPAAAPNPAVPEQRLRAFDERLADDLARSRLFQKDDSPRPKQVELEFPSMVITAKRVPIRHAYRTPAMAATTSPPAVGAARGALFEDLSRVGLLAPFRTTSVELEGHAARVPDARPLPDGAAPPLSPETVRAAVRRQQARFHHCFDAALARHPEAGGIVTVRLAIAPSGAVSRAEALGNTSGDEALPDCVLSALRRVAFPEAGGTMSTTYKLFFHNMDAAAGGR